MKPLLGALGALLPAPFRPYAKAVVGLLGSLLALSQVLWADNPTVAAVVQLATVLGIYAVPNAPTKILGLDVPHL